MPRWHVSIDYGTKAGNLGSWSGAVDAEDGPAALGLASATLKRHRKYIQKFFGGKATPDREVCGSNADCLQGGKAGL